MHKEHEKKAKLAGFAVRSATWIGIGTTLEYALTFLTMVWLARLITPQEFGVASLAISLLSFARLFSDLAMGPALIRREFIDQSHTDVAFISVMILAIFAGLLVLISSSALARYFSTPELQPMCLIVALLIPIHAALSIANALLSRQSAFKFMALSTLPGLLIGYAATSIVLAARGLGAWSILVGSLVQYGLTLIIAFTRARYVPSFKWSATAFGELLSFSFGQSAAQIMNQLALSGDNLVVGRSLGMAPLGLYGRAYKLMELPVTIVSTSLFKVLFPLMSSMQGRRERLAEAYLASLQGLVTVLIPTSVFLIFVAQPLVILVLGPNWGNAVVPFQILCVALTFRAAYRHINLPTLIYGRTIRLTFLSALYALWVIGGAIAAVVLIGTIKAVATAVVIAIVLHYLISAWSTNRQLKIQARQFAQLHVPGLLIGCVVATCLWLARASRCCNVESFSALALDLVISFASIALCLYLWPRWFLGTRMLSILTVLFGSVPEGGGPLKAWLANASGTDMSQKPKP